MPTKTKKHRVKVTTTPVATVKEKPAKKQSALNTADILPISLVFLYLFVDFIPRFDSADVMGAQWVYLVFVNVASAAYIFFARKNISNAVAAVSKNAVSIVFTALYLLAAFSIFAAMNKTESFVCYARFTTTFLAYFSIATLLYNKQHLFKVVAQILSVFLLLQSLDILNEFFSGLGNTTLGDLIFNLKGNAGNKNIMAATLVMKIPFAAYCIYSLKTFGKIANILILALGTLAVFFINARASYLSLILVSILYIAYCVYEYFQHKSLADLGKRIGLFFVPIIITFALSNLIIDNQLQLETKESSYGYGSVTERLGTISFTKEGSNLRMYQWLSAVDYIKKHPAMGAGFGNWKLVSIPYEKTFSDEMYITYHVHNDFLETTAELGWFGGLLYLGLYVLMLVMTLKVVFSDASRDNKQMSVFGLMALSVYFIDAMFNFPLERPIMQVFLAFIMAVHVTSYLAARKESGKPLNVGWAAPAFAAIALVLAMFTYFFNHQTYKSMVAQNLYNADMLTANPVRKSYEVIPALPDIPNLNVFGFPIDAIKARYLLAEKKYDESLAYLNKSANVNPYISYNEFLKGNLFMETQKWDSALYYAKKCFYMKPRAKSNYQLYNAVLAHYKDSTEARKAFEEVTKYRKEPWIWNDYVSILYMCGKDYKTLFQIADQGAKMFPNDVELKKKQKDLGAIQNQPR